MMRKVCLWFCGMCMALTCVGQDSAKVFTLQEFLDIVYMHHPVVSQAHTLPELARMNVRYYRGGFDPKLDIDVTQKVFKGNNYYGYTDAGLKVPLWFGPDLMFGYENNTGQFVNPSDFTPAGGLEYVGISVPIGKNLLIDERRTQLRQAQAMQDASEAERIKAINKVLLYAVKAYWEWSFTKMRTETMENIYRLAVLRSQGVASGVLLGDLSAMDSLEASAAQADRYVEWQNAMNDMQNAMLVVSTFLWAENNVPLELDTMLSPEVPHEPGLFELPSLASLMDSAMARHPDILKAQAKLQQSQMELRLQKNNMLPAANLTYKYLTTPTSNILNDLNRDYAVDNYKIMFRIIQPLFIRKERGKYAMARIKTDQMEWELAIVQRDVENGVATAYNDVYTYQSLIDYQKRITAQYKLLFEAETMLYNQGESSLFKVTARESKYLEAVIKLYQLQVKWQKSIAELYNSAGVLINK